MISKVSVIAAMLFMSTYAAAGSTAIGTASARGDLRIDGYTVKGNATLFDGTVVETGQATAALRLVTGVEIKLATESRSTLYRDRLVLQQGKSEFAPSSPFSLEANGLHVTPSQPNSRALVSMTASNTVDVAALAGGFQITNDRGLLLAHLDTGRAMSFGMQAGSPGAGPVKIQGQLIKSDGHYYIVEDLSNKTYELSGKGFFWKENHEVIITGTLNPNPNPTGSVLGSINVTSMTDVPVSGVPYGIGTKQSFIQLGSIAAAGALIGWAISDVTQSSTPASR